MGINTRQRILLMIGLPVVLIYVGIVWFTLDRLGDQAEAGVEREYAVRAHRYASLFDAELRSVAS